MPRELSPEITHKKRSYDQGPAAQSQQGFQGQQSKPTATPAQPDYKMGNMDFVSAKSNDEDYRRQVNYQFEQIRRHLRDTDARIEEVNKQLRATQESHRLRNEQVQRLQRDLERFLEQGLQRINSQFSVRIGKLREKVSDEHKVQELIDRHNQIVQRFELRLEQMQRLMGEQDIKLLSYSDTLKEIRRQLPPKL